MIDSVLATRRPAITRTSASETIWKLSLPLLMYSLITSLELP